MEYFPEVVRLLRKEQRNIPVIAGGIIPDEDIPLLLTSGVTAVFTPGTPVKTIVQYIYHKWIDNRDAVLL
jgi:methylmalonyl-CoA mutase C-terminal domain/subunit